MAERRSRSNSEPGSEFDDFAAVFEERFAEKMAAVQPFLAKVTGKNAGRVKVRAGDDEFTAGFARNKGVRHNVGDDVLMMPIPGGDPVIVSLLTEADGAGEQAVGNPDLYDGSVDDKKLKANAVSGPHVQPGAIDRAHVRANAVGSTELAPSTVDRGHVKANAIGGTELASGAVDRGHIKANAVGGTQLEGGAVDRAHIRTNAVGSTQLDNQAVTSSHIKTKAVGRSQLDDKAVDTAQLESGSVTGDKLASGVLPDMGQYVKRSTYDNDIADLKSQIVSLERRVKRLE